MGHIKMMGAVQPFISGAISKTVNMPESATVEEVAEVYFQGWKMGIKALAIYRDNCKVGQPLSDGKAAKVDEVIEAVAASIASGQPIRRRLPKSRPSRTTSFSVAGAEGYMTAGAYDDGALGEVFLKLGKQGSTLAGVMDAFSIAISIALSRTLKGIVWYIKKHFILSLTGLVIIHVNKFFKFWYSIRPSDLYCSSIPLLG
jgi:ribonucleoside-diphosphate reductase alpha chain